MKKPAVSGNFRSAEYLDGLFRLAEGLVLDHQDRVELGKRYRRAIEMAGLDQQEFGARIGFSDRHVRSYMLGAVDNATAPARRWAEITGVRYEWLLTGEGSPFPASDEDRLARVEELLEALLVEIREMRGDDGDDESPEAPAEER